MNNKKILTIIRGEEFKLSLKEKIETTDIFYDQYLEAANMLDDIVAINDDEKRADWRRVETENNIIAFCGDRGEGKSSVMMTFINALSNKDAWNQDPIFSSCEHVKRTAFSRPVFIDPSTFDHVHNILEVVVARLYREYRVRYENDPGAFENEKCGKLLEKFQKVYRIVSVKKFEHGLIDGLNSYHIEFYVENQSDQGVIVYLPNTTSINDYQVGAYYTMTQIASEKKGTMDSWIYDSDIPDDIGDATEIDSEIVIRQGEEGPVLVSMPLTMDIDAATEV